MAFSLRENFKAIQWGPTLLLQLMRSVSAGIVWTVILLAAGLGSQAFQAIFMVPLYYLIGVPFVLLMIKAVGVIFGAIGFGWAVDLGYGFFTLILALGIMVGDPILFFLNKIKPGLLPVEKFNFLNFTMILFVLDPAKA